MEILLSIRSKNDGSVREVQRDIGNGLVLGRGAEKGVLLDGPDLSREHLVLTTDDDAIYVTDLSSNGTWVNGSRMRKSLRSRVRFEEPIEVPGYVLTLHPAEEERVEKAEKAEAVVVQMPSPAQSAPTPRPGVFAESTAEPPRRPGRLEPVFRFLGSFTFMEKFLVLVGLGGLLLLYAYVGG